MQRGRIILSDRDDGPVLPDLTVYVAETPASSGLLDQHGRPLARKPEPIGYIRPREH